MKRLLIIALAVLAGGVFDHASAATAAPATPAPQTATLLAGGDVQINQYYRHRRRRVFVGYRTYRVVKYRHGVRYVSYVRRPVYVWR